MTRKGITVPTAFSLVRFSHPRQRLGDSKRRQVEGAEKWCQRNQGYTLDQSLRVKDVSAFRGRHLKVGALAQFLEAIREGLVPSSSVLICESLDRISRQNLDTARETARSILLAGVEIVTFAPERRYNRASLDDPLSLMEMSLIFARAHEESEMKSHRIEEVWRERRKVARTKTEAWGRLCPWWLERNDDHWRIIPERAALVRQIFEWKAEGYGADTVTRKVNALKDIPKPANSDAWSAATINNYLRTRTVLGEYQPHRIVDGKRVPDGDPIPGYYPQIVTPDLFHRAQASFKGAKPGRHALDDQIVNIFSGILRNGYDGFAVQLFTHARYYKGQRNITRYLVSKGGVHVPGACTVRIIYQTFETVFLRYATTLSATDFAPKKGPQVAEIAEASGRLGEAQHRVEELKSRHKNARDAKERAFLLEMVLDARRDVESAEEALEALRLASDSHAVRTVEELKDLATALAEHPETAKDLRLRIKSRLSTLIDKITIYPVLTGGTGRTKKRYEVAARIEFRAGGTRYFVHDHTGALQYSLSDKVIDISDLITFYGRDIR